MPHLLLRVEPRFKIIHGGGQETIKRGHERGRKFVKEHNKLDNEIHAGAGTKGRGKKEITLRKGYGRGQCEI